MFTSCALQAALRHCLRASRALPVERAGWRLPHAHGLRTELAEDLLQRDGED